MSISRKTVLEWCKTGRIPATAVPYGRKVTWVIPRYALELTQARMANKSKQAALPKAKEHESYINIWIKALRSGSYKGKVYSQRTIDDYYIYVSKYLENQVKVSPDGLKRALNRTGKSQYATREHLFKALLCFARFLLDKNAIDKETVEAMEALCPMANPNPKRLVSKEEDLTLMRQHCTGEMEMALLDLMTNTGLRVSEVCDLDWSDIDLTTGQLIVRNGKGGKSRKLGLNELVIASLQAYQATMATPKETAPVFLDKLGKRIHRNGILQRIQRMAKDSGVEANCHSLRRYFVTSRAAAGKPLALIQKAAGHSSLRTTQLYIRIDDDAIVAAMRQW